MRDRESRLHAMVAEQIAARGVRDAAVLGAMRVVPRDAFVEPAQAPFAYDDAPLPIGAGQTISQPYVVAVMLEAAEIAATDTVLEVGAGSGYLAALMGQLALRVIAIERQPVLAAAARQRLVQMHCSNVEIVTADGTEGYPAAAPFHAIIVSAGGPTIPRPLRDQLAIGGRLVMPVGRGVNQQLIRLVRTGLDSFEEDRLGSVRFVPLIGAHGWPASRL